MRPVAYLRVSTREQVEDGYSIEAQTRAIAAFCVSQGWPAPTLFADEGRSGFTDVTEDRPAFSAMLDQATAGGFDVVVVHRLDRFARSLLVTLRELGRLEKSGVSFVSINENMNFATPIGRVFLAMLAALAEYYSRNLSAEIRKGLHEKRRQGLHIGGLPYGALSLGGTLAIDPDQADTLRTILALCATNHNQAVADVLNRRHIPAHRGGIWHASAVASFRRTAGWLEDQPDPWPALARAIVIRPHGLPVNRVGTVRMLSGLLRCSCGGTLVYHTITPTRRWGRCRNAANPGRRGCRDWGTLEGLEAAVEDWLFALPDPRVLAPVPDDAPRRQDSLAAAEDKWEARRRRVIQLYRDGLLSEGEYVAERASLLAHEARLPVVAGGREALGLGLALARRDWPTWDEAARNGWLRELVKHFVVERGTIAPVWQPRYAALFGEHPA